MLGERREELGSVNGLAREPVVLRMGKPRGDRASGIKGRIKDIKKETLEGIFDLRV